MLEILIPDPGSQDQPTPSWLACSSCWCSLNVQLVERLRYASPGGPDCPRHPILKRQLLHTRVLTLAAESRVKKLRSVEEAGNLKSNPGQPLFRGWESSVYFSLLCTLLPLQIQIAHAPSRCLSIKLSVEFLHY